jgi:hypothetical protein
LSETWTCYGADEDEAGAIVLVSTDELVAGAADDDEADEEAGAEADELDEAGAEADELDEAGAGAEDEAGADDDETATDELALFTTVVVLPRLKIQIRPMMTITATMMIIQVLRFMGGTLGWWN